MNSPIIKNKQLLIVFILFHTSTDLVMEVYIFLSSNLEQLETLLCWNKKSFESAQMSLTKDREKQGLLI